MSALAQVSAQSVERTRRSVATMTVWWHVARSAARGCPTERWSRREAMWLAVNLLGSRRHEAFLPE